MYIFEDMNELVDHLVKRAKNLRGQKADTRRDKQLKLGEAYGLEYVVNILKHVEFKNK